MAKRRTASGVEAGADGMRKAAAGRDAEGKGNGTPRIPTAARRKKGILERIRDRESLAGVDLRFLWLAHWDLSRLDLRQANLRGTHLVGSDLSAADLRGAVLEGADLTNACLRGANLRGANLREALVQGADFRGISGLTKPSLQVLQARGAIV